MRRYWRWLVVAVALLHATTTLAGGRALHPLPRTWLTGYDDRGRTATGAWAGPGVCAVDPAVIPLGSWVTIPHLGTCHALDTGGLVRGFHVDWWVATAAQADALTGWYSGGSWSPQPPPPPRCAAVVRPKGSHRCPSSGPTPTVIPPARSPIAS